MAFNEFSNPYNVISMEKYRHRRDVLRQDQVFDLMNDGLSAIEISHELNQPLDLIVNDVAEIREIHRSW